MYMNLYLHVHVQITLVVPKLLYMEVSIFLLWHVCYTQHVWYIVYGVHSKVISN